MLAAAAGASQPQRTRSAPSGVAGAPCPACPGRPRRSHAEPGPSRAPRERALGHRRRPGACAWTGAELRAGPSLRRHGAPAEGASCVPGRRLLRGAGLAGPAPLGEERGMSTRERTGALLGFAVLAAYVALHWFALVADPPLWRCAACLAIAVGA